MRHTHRPNARVGRRVRRFAPDDRGAALVEFAFVFPLLFLLVAGMIDFGLTFSHLNSTRQGVREGARQAVVANFGSDTTCSTSGSITSEPAKKAICLTKDRIGLKDSDVRVKLVIVGENQVGDSLLVCAQYPMSSATGVFAPVMDDRVLTSKVEMRIEKADADLADAQEDALPHSDWSWCA